MRSTYPQTKSDQHKHEMDKHAQGILSVIQMRLSPAAVAAAREGQAAQLGIDDFGLSYSTKGTCVYVRLRLVDRDG